MVISDNKQLERMVQEAEDALCLMDSDLGSLISRQRPVIHYPRADYFSSLCRSILGQQVSVASALATYNRLDTVTGLDPINVSRLEDDEARALGLSRQKSGYIRDLAQHFAEQPDVYTKLDQQTDEEIIAELVAVKGIGVWTAQMFLMFTLSRLDVFAPDDIGLQRGIKLLYGWEKLPSRDELILHAERWAPYRTVASWHLWESLHNVPAESPAS